MDFGSGESGRGCGGSGGGAGGRVGRERVHPGIKTNSFAEGEDGAGAESLQLSYNASVHYEEEGKRRLTVVAPPNE